ncbi:MAG: magnesium transporter CorA family protein [Bdellovibrionales bacterium]
MITLYSLEGGRLAQGTVEGSMSSLPDQAVWIDLSSPTREEEALVEQLVGVGVPTHDEMQEIETSSRLYTEDGATVMTMSVLHKANKNGAFSSSPVTFILFDVYLVTVRYADPAPVAQFVAKAKRHSGLASSSHQILLGLLEHSADYLADILENATADLEGLSQTIFTTETKPGLSTPSYREAISRIGQVGDLATKAKGSLLNLTRLLLFFATKENAEPEVKERMKVLMQDASSIDEHARFLSAKVSFLMDATMGLINLEQNNIIKMFSVAAVIFLPPTLIASLYGMNFDYMPELAWHYGYVFAILLMILSTAIPLWLFWRKKWL